MAMSVATAESSQSQQLNYKKHAHKYTTDFGWKPAEGGGEE